MIQWIKVLVDIFGREIEDSMVNVSEMSLNEKIENAVKESIEHLQKVIKYETYDANTHRALIVNGWDSDQDSLQAVAKYLVGLRATAMDVALNICSVLFDDTPEGKIDILNSVFEIVGENNDALTDIQIRDERNPWLAEGLWHLCMFLSKEIKECHPSGEIIALGPVHVKAKDHGLDGIVLYEKANNIGLSLIESKAYKDDPNRAINKALGFFKEIDNEKHSTRIRQDISNIRRSLPIEIQDKVVGTFWRRERTYIPNPHYDSSTSMDWTNGRKSFESLLIGRDNIIIMPNIITNFDSFFNEISNKMRDFARSL